MSEMKSHEEHKLNKETKENIAISNIACGGLIAAGLVILQAFITIKPLDTAEFISMLAFAAAIPLLAGKILQNFLLSLPNKDSVTLGCSNTYYLGVQAALIGLGAAFWHASYITGIVFIVSSVIAFVSFFLRSIHLHQEEVPLSLDKREGEQV